MKVIFEDKEIQQEYEEIKKKLIEKYGVGCSAVYFSPALVTSQIDDSREIYTMAVFEKSDSKLTEELIEDGNNMVGYSHSFKEDEVVPDEYSEVISLER